MEKLENDLREIGIRLDTSMDPWSIASMLKQFNEPCHKFCSDKSDDTKKMFLPEYLYKLKKEEGLDETAVGKFFGHLIATCKKNYKASKEMKLILKLIERTNNSNKKSCICYMKLRKFVLESQGKSNDHSISLGDLSIDKKVIHDFSKKIELDEKAIRDELSAMKADLNDLRGPELALAVLKVFNSKTPAPATATETQPAASAQKQAATTAPSINYGSYEDMDKYKKHSYISKLLQDRGNNLDTVVKILFKLHGDKKFNPGITGEIEEFENVFAKYLKKKLAENATKLCGTIADDYSKKAEDKKTIAQIIKFLNAYIGHQLGKLEKMSTSPFDEAAHKKYHDVCCNLYLCEYIKKYSMVKFQSVYNQDAGPILDEVFAKLAAVDKVVMDQIINVVEPKLKSFMVQSNLESKLL